jgi:hypothetical protein
VDGTTDVVNEVVVVVVEAVEAGIPDEAVTGEVVVVVGESNGKPIEPLLSVVPVVTTGTLVAGAEVAGTFEAFFFFLADGFATGFRTTRTGVAFDAVAFEAKATLTGTNDGTLT